MCFQNDASINMISLFQSMQGPDGPPGVNGMTGLDVSRVNLRLQTFTNDESSPTKNICRS